MSMVGGLHNVRWKRQGLMMLETDRKSLSCNAPENFSSPLCRSYGENNTEYNGGGDKSE